jgi:predicted Zn-dependent peptidase
LRAKRPPLLTVGSACTGLEDPEDLSFEMISNMLNGFSPSGEFRKLRVEYAESFYMHANCLEERRIGTFTIDLDSSPDEVEKNLRAVLDELVRIRSSLVDARDLEMAKMHFLGKWQARLSSASGIARAVGNYFIHGAPTQSLSTLEARVRAVTPARVRAVARRYFMPGQLVVVAVGDPDVLDEPLRRVGTVTWRDAVEKNDVPSQYRDEVTDGER